MFAGSAPEHPAYDAVDGPDWPLDMLWGVLDTSMNAFDKLGMEAFGNRTISIPTGSIPTLEFALTDVQKKSLYDSGYEAAKQFFAAGPTPTNRFGVTPP